MIRWFVAVVAVAAVACGGSDPSLQAFCEAWELHAQQAPQSDREADAGDEHDHDHNVEVVLLANAPADIRHDVGLVVADQHRPHNAAEPARQRIADYTNRNCG